MSIQVLNNSEDGDSTSAMSDLLQSLPLPTSTSPLPIEMFSPTFKWNLLYFSVCHFLFFPVTGHHRGHLGQRKMAPFSSPHHILLPMDKIPLKIFLVRLNSPSSLTQFFFVCQMLQHTNHLCGLSLDSLQYTHVFLVLRSPALVTGLLMSLTSAG